MDEIKDDTTLLFSDIRSLRFYTVVVVAEVGTPSHEKFRQLNGFPHWRYRYWIARTHFRVDIVLQWSIIPTYYILR